MKLVDVKGVFEAVKYVPKRSFTHEGYVNTPHSCGSFDDRVRLVGSVTTRGYMIEIHTIGGAEAFLRIKDRLEKLEIPFSLNPVLAGNDYDDNFPLYLTIPPISLKKFMRTLTYKKDDYVCVSAWTGSCD